MDASSAAYTALPTSEERRSAASAIRGDAGAGDAKHHDGSAPSPLLPTHHPTTPPPNAGPSAIDDGPPSSELKSQSLQSLLLGEGFLKHAFKGTTEARETQKALLNAMQRAHVTSDGGLHSHTHIGDWTNGEIAGGGQARKAKRWGLVRQSVATTDDRIRTYSKEELSMAALHVKDGQHDRAHEWTSTTSTHPRWYTFYHAHSWLMVYFAACLIQLCLAAVEKPSPELAAMAANSSGGGGGGGNGGGNGSGNGSSNGSGGNSSGEGGGGGGGGGATERITVEQWNFQMCILGVDMLCVLIYFVDIMIRFKLIGAASVCSFFTTSKFGLFSKIRFAVVCLMIVDDGVAWATAFNCIRFSRFLRPLMIILRFRQIRMVFMGYLKAIPSMLSVLLLILLMVTFYALTGFLLFHHDDSVSARFAAHAHAQRACAASMRSERAQRACAMNTHHCAHTNTRDISY